jgi:hypothetical protein
MKVCGGEPWWGGLSWFRDPIGLISATLGAAANEGKMDEGVGSEQGSGSLGGDATQEGPEAIRRAAQAVYLNHHSDADQADWLEPLPIQAYQFNMGRKISSTQVGVIVGRGARPPSISSSNVRYILASARH